MPEKLYVISKRKLDIKEIYISSSTFIKAQDVFETIFFDRESAKRRLYELIEERSGE